MKDLNKRKKIDKKYYETHKKEINERRREYVKSYNDSRKKFYKKYHIENKEKIREYRKKRRLENPRIKIEHSIRRRMYKVLKYKYKSASTIELLGYSIEELKLYLEKQFKKGMSWENYGKWHIDHIKPCSSFNLLLEEEQKKCFHYTNLQPLWAEENLEKGNKIIIKSTSG